MPDVLPVNPKAPAATPMIDSYHRVFFILQAQKVKASLMNWIKNTAHDDIDVGERGSHRTHDQRA